MIANVSLRLLYPMSFEVDVRSSSINELSSRLKIEILVLRHEVAVLGRTNPRLWVPETRLTSPDLLLRRRRKRGMISRWRCG